MATINFLIKGSSSEPYKVVFAQTGDGQLTATCTCQAGLKGTYCKHRMAILEGNFSAIVSGNTVEAETIQKWFKGTELETIFLSIISTEAQINALDKELNSFKKKLARTMLGNKK